MLTTTLPVWMDERITLVLENFYFFVSSATVYIKLPSLSTNSLYLRKKNVTPFVEGLTPPFLHPQFINALRMRIYCIDR